MSCAEMFSVKLLCNNVYCEKRYKNKMITDIASTKEQIWIHIKGVAG